MKFGNVRQHTVRPQTGRDNTRANEAYVDSDRHAFGGLDPRQYVELFWEEA